MSARARGVGVALRAASCFLVAACAQTEEAPDAPWLEYFPPPPVASPNIISGFVGATDFGGASARSGSGLDISDLGLRTFPMLGGIAQHALRDGVIQIGVEGGLTLGWSGDRTVITAGNGTVITESDNDVFLVDGFVGGYVNLPLEGGWRFYGGAGPVLQFASVSLEFEDVLGFPVEVNESGVGGGYYVRTGFEIDVGDDVMVGFGLRWLDSYVDLGGGLDGLYLEGIQYGLTASLAY